MSGLYAKINKETKASEQFEGTHKQHHTNDDKKNSHSFLRHLPSWYVGKPWDCIAAVVVVGRKDGQRSASPRLGANSIIKFGGDAARLGDRRLLIEPFVTEETYPLSKSTLRQHLFSESLSFMCIALPHERSTVYNQIRLIDHWAQVLSLDRSHRV